MANASRSLKSKVRHLDNHHLSVLASVFLISAFLIYLLATGALILSAWYFNLLFIPGFIAGMMSGISYLFGRIPDAWSKDQRQINKFQQGSNQEFYVATLLNPKVPTQRQYRKWERYLTTLGVILAIALTICLAVFHRHLPFAENLSGFKYVLLWIANTSLCAGLGNRVGVCMDEKTRIITEKAAMTIAALVGFSCSLIFIGVGISGFDGLVALGVLTFLATGPFPMVLAAIFFVIGSTSIAMSSADYLMRSINLIFYLISTNKKSEFYKPIQKNLIEYEGALIGVIIGLVCGAIVACCMPYLSGGIIAIAAAAFVMAVSTNIFASIGARVGRLLNAYWKMNNMDTPAVAPVANSQTFNKTESVQTSVQVQKPSENTQSSAIVPTQAAAKGRDLLNVP